MSHSHSHSHSHGDDHSHSHSHSHGNDDVTANESQTLLEHNRKHFDSKAKTYINEASTFMAKHCKEAIVAAATGDLSEKSALDFACGPGTVSLQLAHLLKEVVGADISTGMVEEYGNQVSLTVCRMVFDAYDCFRPSSLGWRARCALYNCKMGLICLL